ncbi:Transforming growth factor-beta-induced protein ig-h3 [Halotydeus destructor]|nr:Transforming growth factor-beta-induced protein ig-h3 [Halotydeus destructor]
MKSSPMPSIMLTVCFFLTTGQLAESANFTSGVTSPTAHHGLGGGNGGGSGIPRAMVAADGPWTPMIMPRKAPLVSHATTSGGGNLARASPQYGSPTASASEPRSYKSADMNNFPPPMIKHRENGATVGLDLPDSNLRLLLDIDELASKPISENIKFKVIERQSRKNGNNFKPSSGPTGAQYVAQSHQQPQSGHSGNNGRSTNRPQVVVGKAYQNYGIMPPSAPQPQFKSNLAQGSQATSKQYKIGYVRAADLHTVLHKNVGPEHANKYTQNSNQRQQGRSQTSTHNGFRPTGSNSGQGQGKFSQPLPSALKAHSEKPLTSGFASQSQGDSQLSQNHVAAAASNSHSKTNAIKGQRHQGKTNTSPQSPSVQSKTKQSKVPPPQTKSKEPTKQADPVKGQPEQRNLDKDDDDIVDEQVASKARGPTEKPSFTTPAESFTSEEQQKHMDADEEEDVELVGNDDVFGTDDAQAELREATTPSTNAHSDKLVKRKEENKNDIAGEVEDDINPDDFTILKPFPANPTAARQDSCPASSCQTGCMPSNRRLAGDMDSLTLREFSKKIGADALFDMFPEMEDQFQLVADFATSGFTMFLPSNEAVRRLPKALVKSIKSNPDMLKKIVENHVSDEKHTMSNVQSSKTLKPRASSAKLTINSQKDFSMTINGQRLVQMNLNGPMDSVIHVIDGLLYPVADKDIMKTLKSCNKFDGFVTLAEGTGISDKLTGDGPFTLFVPSNEALQKIPDADLDRIRNNMTSLKEFLMYHVAEGSFYSADLKDGQFLPSMLADQEIQVGVRVDGCSRRLVEANVSPLYRADIPASNGVIHVVDWILKPNDRDWCEGMVLPRR